MSLTITCVAPVNIAVIKYWGKRDEELILPINDSISASLDVEQLCAKTTVMISPDFETDRIWLNGREESMSNERLQNCLREIRKKAETSPETRTWKLHVWSRNNFPTAAGLASSAAGYACLAVALAKLYNFQGDASAIARIGSGSACRSTLGGFVKWRMGTEPGGDDSVAKLIAPASHWPQMRVLILVVSDDKKKVSSAVGMRRAVETSEFSRYRAEVIVPKRIREMERAIIDKDFDKFAELTIKDSNSMHAVALDSYPPCFYLNDVSRLVIDLIHAYNTAFDSRRVAYTNDAGPNTVLYLLEENVAEVLGVIRHFLPADKTTSDYVRGETSVHEKPSPSLLERIKFDVQRAGLLKYIIRTKVGEGPKILEDPREHLLDVRGLPVEPVEC